MPINPDEIRQEGALISFLNLVYLSYHQCILLYKRKMDYVKLIALTFEEHNTD